MDHQLELNAIRVTDDIVRRGVPVGSPTPSTLTKLMKALNDDHAVLLNMRRYVTALVAGDWDALADAVADEHLLEDRRLGMKVTLDKAGNIEQARVIADLAVDRDLTIDLDVIETRGERLALIRQVYRAEDFVIPVLVVMEVDDNGRTPLFIVFDEDDLAAARAELEALAAKAGG
jgi:hypothetical protein